ncbi:sugar ABC transporter permease [soil metagenome]
MLRTATASAGSNSRSSVRPTVSRLFRQPWGYLLPAAVILGALSVFPLVQLARMAFSEVGPRTIVGPWEFIGWSNFRDAFDDRIFWKSVRATGTFTLVLLFVDLVVGYLGAAVLSSGAWSTNLALRIMVFVWALPPIVSGSVLRFLLAGNGAINSLLGLAGMEPVDWLSSPDRALLSVSLVAAWASLPFSILVIHGGLLSMPNDVIEAARIDGAGFWRLSLPVVLPILRPTLTVLTVLIIPYAFRSFDFVYVMTEGGPGTTTTTLPYFAYNTAFKTYKFGVASALAMVSMLVVIVLAVPYMLGLRKEHAS